MPTGYTAVIEKGISVRDFIMRCAKAMGACIMMRDDPMDAPIPERFEPSDYHLKEIVRIKSELAELKAMSNEQAQLRANADYEKESVDTERRIRERMSLRDKYESMLSEVRKWVPPTTDHTGLKDFMVKQITESIDFDCSTEYLKDNAPSVQSGAYWKDECFKSLLRDLDYHRRENAKEISRTEARNNWISQLRVSLPIEKTNG